MTLSDRELILKRIAYQIEECDKSIRNDPHQCMIASEYAKGEILGLTSLREFIEASIPDEMERLMMTVDGIEHLSAVDKIDQARRYISDMDDAGAEVDGPRRVAIRFLEDKSNG